ncbi:hypothetical protein GCM10010433_62640 [Streptomyces pulveraceus]
MHTKEVGPEPEGKQYVQARSEGTRRAGTELPNYEQRCSTARAARSVRPLGDEQAQTIQNAVQAELQRLVLTAGLSR